MDWIQLAVALIETSIRLAPLNLQVPVEIPNTVIGLVAFLLASETGIIIFLLRQIFTLTAKYAELVGESAKGTALFAKSLDEVAAAVREGRDVDALTRKIDELTLQSKTAVGRNRKS